LEISAKPGCAETKILRRSACSIILMRVFNETQAWQQSALKLLAALILSR
jgi:hypothetical protein